MSKLKKLTSVEADATGTSLKGYLLDTTYIDLCDAFGEPTYMPEDSGDGKIHFEWVFDFNGETFTLYDWKTYDEEYSLTELTKWNVGGKVFYGDFIDHIESVIYDKRKETTRLNHI